MTSLNEQLDAMGITERLGMSVALAVRDDLKIIVVRLHRPDTSEDKDLIIPLPRAEIANLCQTLMRFVTNHPEAL